MVTKKKTIYREKPKFDEDDNFGPFSFTTDKKYTKTKENAYSDVVFLSTVLSHLLEVVQNPLGMDAIKAEILNNNFQEWAEERGERYDKDRNFENAKERFVKLEGQLFALEQQQQIQNPDNLVFCNEAEDN